MRAKRDLGWVPTKGDEDFLKGVEEEAASILAGLPDKAALGVVPDGSRLQHG